jgi:hypothetical protein
MVVVAIYRGRSSRNGGNGEGMAEVVANWEVGRVIGTDSEGTMF